MYTGLVRIEMLSLHCWWLVPAMWQPLSEVVSTINPGNWGCHLVYPLDPSLVLKPSWKMFIYRWLTIKTSVCIGFSTASPKNSCLMDFTLWRESCQERAPRSGGELVAIRRCLRGWHSHGMGWINQLHGYGRKTWGNWGNIVNFAGDAGEMMKTLTFHQQQSQKVWRDMGYHGEIYNGWWGTQ